MPYLTWSIIIGVAALAVVILYALAGGAKLGGPEDPMVGGVVQDRRTRERALLAEIETEYTRMAEKNRLDEK